MSKKKISVWKVKKKKKNLNLNSELNIDFCVYLKGKESVQMVLNQN